MGEFMSREQMDFFFRFGQDLTKNTPFTISHVIRAN